MEPAKDLCVLHLQKEDLKTEIRRELKIKEGIRYRGPLLGEVEVFFRLTYERRELFLFRIFLKLE